MRAELAEVLGTERFLRKIDIATQITHPPVLSLHDSGARPTGRRRRPLVSRQTDGGMSPTPQGIQQRSCSISSEEP